MRLFKALPLLFAASCASVAPRFPTRTEPLGSDGPTKPISLTFTKLPENAPHQLSADRGSVVLLEVWASWCDACRASMPFYEELARELGPRGLKVYALSIDADPRQVPRYVEETKLSLPVLHDPEGRLVERELHVRTVPTTFVLDRTGAVRLVREGFDQAHLKTFVRELDRLLGPRPVDVGASRDAGRPGLVAAGTP